MSLKTYLSVIFYRKQISGLALIVCTLSLTFHQSQNCFAANRLAIKSVEVETKVYELCNRSSELISAGSYSQAIDLLRQAAVFDPTSYSPNVHTKLSECFRALKQYPQTIKECELAIKSDPNFCSAYYSLAQAYYDSENYDAAAKTIRKLMQLSKNDHWKNDGQSFLAQIESYGNLRDAIKALKSGQFQKAKVKLLEAAKRDPSEQSACVHANLAYIYRNSGNPELAIEEGKKALKYQSDDKNVVYAVGIAYQDIGKFDESITWLQRYLSLETESGRRKLAMVLIKELQADKGKLSESDNRLPDYLDHMLGGQPLRRWAPQDLPIKVHISSGKDVKGFKSQYASYITRAMDTWCNASGNKLSYAIVPDAKNADLNVSWISEPIVLHESGHDRIKQGLATVGTTDSGGIDVVHVEIDTMSSFEPSKPLNESACASVCMHEIGHALGLNHCANYNDIMYFGASAKQSGMPTKRDCATIARLYEGYSVAAAAPKVKPPEPMRYLPPPAFLPPALPNTDNPVPPMFVPPPIVPEEEMLTPPFFKPSPIGDESPAPPMFVPPPVTKTGQINHRESNNADLKKRDLEKRGLKNTDLKNTDLKNKDLKNKDLKNKDLEKRELEKRDTTKRDSKNKDPKNKDPKNKDPKNEDPKNEEPKNKDPKHNDPKHNDPNKVEPPFFSPPPVK